MNTEMRLIDFIYLYSTKLKFLAYVTLAGVILGLSIPFFIPKKYAGVATFASSSKTKNSNSVMGGESAGGLTVLTSALAAAAGSPSGNIFYISLMKSSRVEDMIINQTKLAEHYGVKNAASARGLLEKNTFIKEDLGGIVTITFYDKDPKIAALVADAYITELNSLLNSMSITEAQKHSKFLGERLKIARDELEILENKLSDYQRKNKVIMADTQLRAGLEITSRIESSIYAERMRLKALREVEREGSPAMLETESNIRTLEDQLQSLYKRPSSTKSMKNKKSGEAISSLLGSPELLAEYNRFIRDIETRSIIYSFLLKEYEMSLANAAKEKIAVEVIDQAEIPTGPASPNKRLILLLSIAISVLLGLIIPVLTEAWKNYRAQPANAEIFSKIHRELRSLKIYKVK
ncbi:MAG: hypothetical protein J0L93_06880 [Deltaproteobacteria bacterium]|nr:hypothetical protein [Deltaproteobacteria bacterium]